MAWSRRSDGTVGRDLASHQCGLGLIPRLKVISGLSLLVLYSVPRGFTLIFSSPQIQPMINSAFN